MGNNPALPYGLWAATEIAGDHCRWQLSADPTMNPFPPRDGGPQFVDHHSKQPAWRRIHRSPFFWVAAIFILVAMTIYIATGNLSTAPESKVMQPAPLAP
jgi:hypothetical protein